MRREYATTPWLYVAGAKTELIDGLIFRLSRAAGFKPPTMGQVTESPPPVFPTSPLSDRRTGKSITLRPDQYIIGGNSSLEPETTDALNIGAIWVPKQLKRFRFSVDYTENTRDTAIASISIQDILDLELGDSRIAERVRRNSAGEIEFIDARNMNFREIRSRSATASIMYKADMFGGNLTLGANATKNISFKIQTSNLSEAVEQVNNSEGVFGDNYFRTNWNGSAYMGLEWSNFGLGWTARYFDNFPVRVAFRNLQGSAKVAAEIEHDARITWRIQSRLESKTSRRLTAGLSISFGLKNVFDRRPRYHAENGELGYAVQDSITGRSYWVSVSKEL